MIGLLAKSDKALSPYHMQAALKKKKILMNAVTIYRVLDAFEGIGIVHKVLAFNGYVKCTMEPSKSCHHYIVCKECRRLDEIEGEDLSRLEAKISKEKGFTVYTHYLEFMGVCKRCSRKR